jgi:hypothetical protein
MIDNPASCKIHAIICFHHATNMSTAQIDCELHTIYSLNVMSEGPVRKLCSMFKDGRTNAHNEE